jgi:AraC-like DNA-binding protein
MPVNTISHSKIRIFTEFKLELSFHVMFEDLKIRQRYDGFVFLADARTLQRIRPHRHRELELNLVERGTITYVVDGRRLRFGPRSLLWLYPDQEHQLVDLTGEARYYVAVFKPSLIRQISGRSAFDGLARFAAPVADSVLHYELAAERFDLLRRMIDAVLEEGLDADTLSREAGFGVTPDFHYEHAEPELLNAGLRLLLIQGWRLQRESLGGSKAVHLHRAVRHALDLLSDSSDSFDLRQIARRCGVSTAYLSRTFARQVGVPVSRYRNAVRLRRFWDCLHDGRGRSLTDAAYAAGFGSYAQFYRVFASAYGSGPRACDAGREHA